MMASWKHVFTPLKVRSLELANRVVMPPMGTNLGETDGSVSEATIAYLRRRAKGKPGLIIMEVTAVQPEGISIDTELCAFDDRYLPGLKKAAAAVHAEWVPIAMQLHHAGRESLFMLQEGKAVGPSPIPSLIYRIPPREMTREDIAATVRAYGDAARRAKAADFDAVEVHGAHGYLPCQFLSALSNQRTDEYGGSMENRARFLREILTEVRRQVGPDFPISVRLSVDECIKGGYTPEELQPVLPGLVAAGADIIHASFGTHGSPGGITSAPIEFPPGFMAGLARKVKETVTVPVIAVGRFTELVHAEAVLARGDADLVAFGRQFLTDPDFIIKTKEGHTDDIRLCLACNQGCIERLLLGEGKVRCAITPETGQETIYPAGPAKSPKRVWVIGAGPAGLTAAYEAARLGHNVTVYEREEQIGGQLRFASVPPYKAAYRTWIEWQARQAQAVGTAIITNTPMTEATLREGKPEAVILATGGEKIIPAIPGRELPHVCDAWQLLGGQVAPGRHVLVIGGGLIGMETADFLREQGAAVTVVELLKRSPVSTFTAHGYMLISRLREAKCPLLFGTRVLRIERDSVVVEREGTEQTIFPVDQVVLAVGLAAQAQLQPVLADLGIPFTVVGDARLPSRILEAVEQGAQAAWDL